MAARQRKDYGQCVNCDRRASCPNPTGSGGVCRSCRYGQCVTCSNKALYPNPNGHGSVCQPCRYGSCVKCGNKANRSNPDGPGGVCQSCWYGHCVRCGLKAGYPNPNGHGSVCASCRYGVCACGKSALYPDSSGHGGICGGCRYGVCPCGKMAVTASPDGRGGLCTHCRYGECVSCDRQATAPNPNGRGGVCKTHWRHGSDYVVTHAPWQPKTLFLYFVYFPSHEVLKVGVGASSGRHEGWLDGGGILLRLITRHIDAVDGTALKSMETSVIHALKAGGLRQARIDELPPVFALKGTKNNEAFKVSGSLAALAACSVLLVELGIEAVGVDAASKFTAARANMKQLAG